MRSAVALAGLAWSAPALANSPPNDFVDQQQSLRAIRALEAWGYETGDPNLIVAVIDSGLDTDHPDLAPNLWNAPGPRVSGQTASAHGWSFVDDSADLSDELGRGTHVAGVIGAAGNNGMGIAGLNWNVSLMGLKVTQGDLLDLSADPKLMAAAIRYAADHGAKVIDLSVHSITDDPDLKSAVTYAITVKDAVVVAAAGDESLDLDLQPEYPAAYVQPGLISVSDVDEGAKLALSSNYGSGTVTLVAPGVNVFSTLPGGFLGAMTGTADAAAHVAGGLALYRALKPNLDAITAANDLTRLACPRAILKNEVSSGAILDLGALIAQKAEHFDAVIVAPSSAQVGTQVIFDGSQSYGPVIEYLWKFGDPDDEFGKVVPRTFHRPGTVGVELFVRSNDGRTASNYWTLTLQDDSFLSSLGCEVGGGRPESLLPLAFGLLAVAVLRRKR